MQRNRFEVTGYLAAKPVLRRLPSGTPVANVRLGESYRYPDGDGKPQQHTNWHSLSFYGDLSLVAATFNKGDNIFVEGTIRQLLNEAAFTGEGYRKIWARLRYQGIRTSKERVLRLLRENQLLSPQRQPEPVKEVPHDGMIVTAGQIRCGAPMPRRPRRRPKAL